VGDILAVSPDESIDPSIPGWRADCTRHQEETINAVKATAQEQVPYNVEGVRYMIRAATRYWSNICVPVSQRVQ
jgi:hypothetical protein